MTTRGDINAVAESFVDNYYTTLDDDPSALAPLYRPSSLLSYAGSEAQGAEAILYMLRKSDQSQHQVICIDAQPSFSGDGGIFVFVCGYILSPEEVDNNSSFSEMFCLLPEPTKPGSYFVQNDIFRFTLGKVDK